MTDCEHGTPLGAAGGCPPCLRAPHLLDAPPEVSRPFPARHDGVCPGCDGPVSCGESIRRVEHEQRVAYRHDDPACIPEEWLR